MDSPLVSVCVPVYGVEKYIERCARSLFEQTYQNVEYVFVNDCSKDASIEVLKKVMADYPERLCQTKIICHDKNLGLGGARNTGVENATGAFLMWVDSDDYIDTQCIEKVVAKQMETDADIVAFDAYWDYGSYKKRYCHNLSGDAYEDCLNVCSCRAKHMVWGRLYRLDLYKRNQIKVIEGCNMGEDRQVVPCLYYFAQKVATLHEPLYYYYNGNESSYTASFSVDRAEQWLASERCVRVFFRDKPRNYRVAVDQGSAIMLSQLIAGCSRSGNKNTYKMIRQHMRDVDSLAVKQVPIFYRMFFLFDNFFISSFYAKVGHFLKGLLK